MDDCAVIGWRKVLDRSARGRRPDWVRERWSVRGRSKEVVMGRACSEGGHGFSSGHCEREQGMGYVGGGIAGMGEIAVCEVKRSREKRTE